MLTLLTLLRSQYAAENLHSAKFVKPDNSFGIIVQPTITIRLGITTIYIYCTLYFIFIYYIHNIINILYYTVNNLILVLDVNSVMPRCCAASYQRGNIRRAPKTFLHRT